MNGSATDATQHVPQAPPDDPPRRGVGRMVPGLTMTVAVAGTATIAGRAVPIVGGPVFGIVSGALLSSLIPALRGRRWEPGYSVAARPVLQLSIVMLGTALSLRQVISVGARSLPVMLGTLLVALGGAWLLGRLLGVDGDTRTLIGVGTGICGASAIATTTAVIGAARAEVAYAIGTIFTFNIAAVVLFPPVGHLLGMSPHAFGLWSGTAINDTSSVAAAAYSYGDDAGPYGIVVKLTRVLALIPIVITLAVVRARRDSTTRRLRLRAMPWRKIVPLFLVGFILAAGLDSLGLIPRSWHPALSALGTFLITTALAGIGLSLRPADMRRAGPRPMLLGGLLWVTVALTSLGLQAITGAL